MLMVNLKLVFCHQTTEQKHSDIKDIEENQMDTRDPDDICGDLDVRFDKGNIHMSPLLFYITAPNFSHNLRINLNYLHKISNESKNKFMVWRVKGFNSVPALFVTVRHFFSRSIANTFKVIGQVIGSGNYYSL